MIYNSPITNLLDQAKLTAQKTIPTTCTLAGTIITPQNQIEIPHITGLVVMSSFTEAHCDSLVLEVGFPPGIYQTLVLPNKDDLYIELIEIMGIEQTATKYRAVPLGDSSPQTAGTTTQTVDLLPMDKQNLMTLQFQLINIGFDLIKNVMVAGNYLSSSPDQIIHSVYTKEINQLGLSGVNAFNGVDFEKPIDNIKLYRQITLQSGLRLADLANFLQTGDGYGVYSRGMCSYYKNNTWFVCPLFKLGRYGTLDWSIDILRMPQDVMPTIEASYYTTGTRGLTILTSGEGQHVNGTDITYQNQGTGQRIVSADAVAGDVGTYVNNGRAVVARRDNVSEYRTNVRKSGDDIVPVNTKPTNNVYRELSKSSFNDGDILNVEWHNSDYKLIFPAAPLKYYYMIKDVMKLREGTMLNVRTEYQPINRQFNASFKKHSVIQCYLGPEQTVSGYSDPDKGNSY